jgi:hypothetical protein
VSKSEREKGEGGGVLEMKVVMELGGVGGRLAVAPVELWIGGGGGGFFAGGLEEVGGSEATRVTNR